MRIAFSLFGVLGAVLLLGCGAREPVPVSAEAVVQRAGSTVEAMVRPTATKVPRLNLPTLTPMPTATLWATATPEPTLDISGRVAVMVPTPQPEPPATCSEHLRLLLETYDGFRLFSDDVNALYAKLAAVRSDCDYALAGSGKACERGTYVGGLRVVPQLLDNLDSYTEKTVGDTGISSGGDVLVHFDDLPGDDLGGCWYYSREKLSWSWRDVAGDYGLFSVDHSECDGLLRERILEDGLEEPSDVAGAVDYVWRQMPSCEVQGWSPYPAVAGLELCGSQVADGVVVIMWQDAYLPFDGVQCWSYDRRTMEWYDGY